MSGFGKFLGLGAAFSQPFFSLPKPPEPPWPPEYTIAPGALIPGRHILDWDNMTTMSSLSAKVSFNKQKWQKNLNKIKDGAARSSYNHLDVNRSIKNHVITYYRIKFK